MAFWLHPRLRQGAGCPLVDPTATFRSRVAGVRSVWVPPTPKNSNLRHVVRVERTADHRVPGGE
jgi:hypothetical protein